MSLLPILQSCMGQEWIVRSRTYSASESVSDLVCRAGIALYVLLGLVSWIKAAGAFGGAFLFCSGLLIGLVTLPVALVSCLTLQKCCPPFRCHPSSTSHLLYISSTSAGQHTVRVAPVEFHDWEMQKLRPQLCVSPSYTCMGSRQAVVVDTDCRHVLSRRGYRVYQNSRPVQSMIQTSLFSY